MKDFFSKLLEIFKPGKPDGGGRQNIRVAKVLKIAKHPNADRLRVVALDIGGKTVEPVVCGASNFTEGDLVALALPGAVISRNIHTDARDSFILEKAKIRGVESQGMICAAFELGLADLPGNGIMLLKKDAVPGAEFSPEMIK